MTHQIKYKAGFSLIEMAIVLTIMSVITYALLSVSTAQIQTAKIEDTKSKMKRIEQAITVFFKTNGYLPCPAYGNTSTSNASFGVESSSATHTSTTTSVSCGSAAAGLLTSTGANPDVYVGVIPTRTLNLPDDYMFDGWDSRITYVVSRLCTSSAHWQNPRNSYVNQFKCNLDGGSGGTATSPNTGSGAKIQIRADTTWMGSSDDPLAVYTIISHGRNKLGAWDRTGSRKTGVAGDSTGEKDNGNLLASGALQATNTIANIIYHDRRFNDGTVAANYFDDITRWRTATQLHYDSTH